MMRRVLLGSLLLLTGCQNIVGPRAARPVRVDDPRLPVPEQERRGRAYLSLPDQSYLSGPVGGMSRPSDPGITINQR
jgi:hypothetical protein